MAEYENRVLFFLDILGFKNIIDNHLISVDEMLKIFSHAQYHLDYTGWIKNKKEIIDSEEENNVEFIQISDSIVLSFKIEQPSGLFYAILDVMRLQANFAALHGIFFRGGCACGELYHKGCTIFGPAMIEAVNLEKIAKYPRIIIPNIVIDKCKKYSINRNYNEKDEKKDILECLKMDKDGYYYIDYISYDTFGNETDSNEQWGEYISQLRKKIKDGLYKQEALDKYIWLKEKYNKTLTDILINNYKNNCDIKLSRL